MTLVAYDCSNDHHGRECGRRPCDCQCHVTGASPGRTGRSCSARADLDAYLDSKADA